jgi:hypothetical protein
MQLARIHTAVAVFELRIHTLIQRLTPFMQVEMANSAPGVKWAAAGRNQVGFYIMCPSVPKHSMKQRRDHLLAAKPDIYWIVDDERKSRARIHA